MLLAKKLTSDNPKYKTSFKIANSWMDGNMVPQKRDIVREIAEKISILSLVIGFKIFWNLKLFLLYQMAQTTWTILAMIISWSCELKLLYQELTKRWISNTFFHLAAKPLPKRDSKCTFKIYMRCSLKCLKAMTAN